MNEADRITLRKKTQTAVLGTTNTVFDSPHAAFGAPLKEWGVCAWDIWARPELPMKTRSLITVAMLAVLNRPVELETHMRGALNTGNTPEELREVVLQVAPYGGMPAAAGAMEMLVKVLADKNK